VDEQLAFLFGKAVEVDVNFIVRITLSFSLFGGTGNSLLDIDHDE
jgi:hypothetical protein